MKKYTILKNKWKINIDIDEAYANNDKLVILIMGLGLGSNKYDSDRLKDWKLSFIKKGYDVLTFNNENYIKYIKNNKKYWTPKTLLRIHFSIISFAIDELKYQKLILNGWSSGAITLFHSQKSKYKNYIEALIFNDPSLTIAAIERHLKKLHEAPPSKRMIDFYDKKFNRYYAQTQKEITGFNAKIFIIFAEYRYKFIDENSKFLVDSSEEDGIFYLKNANHSFRLWKANNLTDIGYEDKKIWMEFLSFIDEIMLQII